MTQTGGKDAPLPNEDESARGRYAHPRALSWTPPWDANETAWRKLLCVSGSRDRRIAEARVFAPASPASLRQLGEELAISHERVRQLEQRLHGDVKDRLANDPDCAPVLHDVARLRGALGTCAPQASVATVTRVLCPDGPDAGLRRAVLLTLGGYSLQEGLWERGEALRQIRAELDASDQIGRGEVEKVLNEAGVLYEHHAACVDALAIGCGADAAQDGSGGVSDLLAGLLHAHGKPMSRRELCAALSHDVTPLALAIRLQADPRIRRVGSRTYGLSEWDEAEYGTIADELQREIETRGGSARLEETGLRDHGQARGLRIVGAPRVWHRTLPLAPGRLHRPCSRWSRRTRRQRNWASRLRARQLQRHVHSPPHGRPGSPARLLAPRALRSRFRRRRRAGRGTQHQPRQRRSVHQAWECERPSLGTIRPIAKRLGCEPGDRIFLPLRSGATAYNVKALALDRARRAARLALSLGLTVDATLSEIAQSIGLPGDAPEAEVQLGLSARGEHQLAAALAPGRQRSSS